MYKRQDLAAQERIREIPLATERLLKSTLLSGELVEDLIFPTMLLLNSDVLEPTLGLGFDESRNYNRLPSHFLHLNG